MSIPIKDINAGDTISAMVDKINYNFSLVSLKGGGPAGIQGLQGIRGNIGAPGIQGEAGPGGSSIYSNPNPDPNTMQPGDINIYDGVIQQVYWTPEGNVLQNITNLNMTVQSPFGTSTYHTINPVTSYVDYPIVFGVETASQDNVNILSDNSKSILYLRHNNTDDFIRFYKSGYSLMSQTFTGHITSDNNGFIIGSGQGNNFSLNGPSTNSIHLNADGIYFESRIHAATSNQIYDNSSFIVATQNANGKIDNTAAWVIDKNKLFPVKIGTTSNTIGSKDRAENRLDAIYVNSNASIIFSEPPQANHALSIKMDNIGGLSTQTNIALFSKYGVAIGGIKNNGTLDEAFDVNAFGVKITNPSGVADYGTKLTISSRTNNTSSLVALSEIVANMGDFGSTHSGSIPSESIYGKITLTSAATIDKFMRNMYGNTIVADKNYDNPNIGKNTNDTLLLHGADGAASTGNDVVITGGNTINTANHNFVGGDVYISGGSAISSMNSDIKSDLRRAGNVIIGINPLYHANTFDPSYYNSIAASSIGTESIYVEYSKNASLNPEGIGFFDVNDVAIHGNRIIIDSNANYRKATNDYLFSTNTFESVLPYIKNPNNATLQVSGINTMNHESPVIIGKDDVCSYQFMSGVMRRIIRIKYENDEFTVTEVPIATFYDNPTMGGGPAFFGNEYIGGDTNGSVYFITDQVWQKVGNVVNVQAFGRWVANKPGDTTLYHISDYMFYKPQPTNANQFGSLYSNEWVTQTPPYCYNKTLGKLLLKARQQGQQMVSYSYNSLKSNDNYNTGLINQPMTMFPLPFVIRGLHASHCYGNGNIFTESPAMHVSRDRDAVTGQAIYYIGVASPTGYILYNHSTNSVYNNIAIYDGSPYRKQNPTNSVINSTPVTVGVYYAKENYDYNAGFGSIKPDINGYNNGGRGAIHNSPYNSTGGINDLKSISVKNTDPRFTSSATDHKWDENNFIKAEIINTDYCYIYPEMPADFGNITPFRWPEYKMCYDGEYLRPCVGLYTWISLNYSYTIVPDFTDEFTTFSYMQSSTSPISL